MSYPLSRISLVRRTFLAVFFLFSLQSSASAQELSPDKFGHFQTFYGIGAAMNGLGKFSWQEKTTLGLAPGIMKEILDSTRAGNRFDVSDLAFDALGMLAAVISSDKVLVMVTNHRTIVLTIRF